MEYFLAKIKAKSAFLESVSKSQPAQAASGASLG